MIKFASGWVLIGLGLILILGWVFSLSGAANPRALLQIGLIGAGLGVVVVYQNRSKRDASGK